MSECICVRGGPGGFLGVWEREELAGVQVGLPRQDAKAQGGWIRYHTSNIPLVDWTTNYSRSSLPTGMLVLVLENSSAGTAADGSS